MKKFSIYLVLLGLVVLTSIQNSFTQNVNVSGAVVGNGTYPDLGSAFSAINGGGQTGASIIVSVVGNTTELATATLNQGAWATLTILPVGGATRTINGNIAGPLVDFNGADRVVVDGLNTGGNALIIENSNITTASTIRFINDARSLFVQNCTILGANTSTTSGTVFISTSAGGGGNDSIAFNSCTIDASGANFPTNGVYSLGTVGQENGNIGFNACNISNYFSATTISRGIFADAGNTDWIIDGCKFYQIANRTYTTANTHRAIQISSGNNHSITSNIIGFAAAGSSGTYTMLSTVATRFIGIDLSVGAVTASSVQGNVITSISLNTSSGAATANGVLCGINVTGSGNVNIGNILPNTIGANSGVDRLLATPTTTQGAVVGINSSSTGTILIQNNIIGALSSSGSTASVAGGVFGINISGVATSMTITGNTIGNPTANNMRGGTLGLTTGSSVVGGINASSSATTLVVTNNTIQNLTSYGTGTGGYVRGFFTATSGSSNSTVSGNTIRNLVTSSTLTGYGSGNVGAAGIHLASGNNAVINQNTISNISNINTGTGNYSVIGISCAQATNTTVSNNSIYDLSNAGTGTTLTAPPVIAGVFIRSGTTGINIYNNMISLGTGQTSNTAILGIVGNHGSTPDPIVRIYHNTINITGTVTAGALPSFGIARTDFTATARTATFDVINNIITNDRTGGTGSHYAIANNYGAVASSTTGWPANASNNNVLNANAATVGYWSSANLTFAGWQTAASSDAFSYSGITVNYVNSANDLHLNMGVTPTFIESGGQTIAIVPTDIDAQNRPGPAGSVNGGAVAPDLGADEVDAVPVVCSSASGGTITPSSYTRCENQTQVLTSVGATSGFGITYQWLVSGTPGGPYVNVSGGSGATTTSYTTGPLAAGTFYYVMQTTCSAGPVTGLSNEVTITVNPAPSVVATPASSSYCVGAPGISIDATGTGGVTYTWLPAAGLSSTTGTPVIATPSATTTYTVTATDGSGCTNSATSLVNSAFTPIIVDLTATPSSVCSGGNSQLLATSYTPAPVNDYTFSTSIGAVLDPMTGATTVIGTGNDDTPTAAPAAIGFNFNYHGTNYTQYSVSPDGWILLGGAVAAGDFSNQVTDPTNVPKIYPYWDDIATGTTGNVQTLVTGTAPNRIFIVQWFVTVPRATGGPANSTFQAWLYEADGKIEFRYGTMGAAGMSSSVGLTGSTTNFNCVTVATNTNSTSVTNDANAGQPASGRMYTFTPPVPSFVWTPATFLSSTTISNPMANAVTSTTTYTVAVTNNGCSATASATITSGAALSSSAGASPSASVCVGSSLTLNGTAIGGGGPFNYSWTGPNSFSSPLQNPVIPSVTLADAGTYSLTITDACFATSNSTVAVSVNSLPNVNVSPSSATYCSPGPAITLTGSGASTYSWLPITGLSAITGTSVDATPTALTTYTVTGTDANGCSATASTIINSGSTPSVVASVTPAAICIGSNADLIATATLPAPTYCQPIYSNGTGFGDFISNVTLNTLNNTTGASASPYYTLFPASGSTTTTLIAGNSYTITLTPGTYTINDIAAWIDFDQNGTLNNPGEKLGETDNMGAAPATTSFIFTVPITALNGTTRLRVREMDHATTNDMDPCLAQSTFGETEDYIITIVGGVDQFTYSWSPSTFLSGTTNDTVTAIAATSTTPYTVIATSLTGCTGTANTTLTVNPLPTPTATNTGPYCVGGTIQLNSPTGSATDDWTGPLSYNQTNTQNPTIASATTGMAGDYTVTVTDGNGCSATATTTVVVNTLPLVNVSGTSPICSGDTALITGTSGGTSQWYLNGVLIPAATSNTYLATLPGVYNMIKTNLNGCFDSAAVGFTLVVNPLPTATANNTGDYCAGETIQLNSPSGSATDDWTGPLSYNQTNTQNPTIASSTVAMSGDYTVTVTDVNGCSATATTTVLVNPAPTVSANNTGPYCEGATIQLNSPDGSATDDWTGPLTYSQTDTQNPTIVSSTVAMSGDYTVTVTDGNGCSATATTAVVVNAFPTPSATNTGPYCEGATIQLNSPSGSATDDWTGPLTYSSTDTQNPTIASSTIAMSGDYTVTVTNGAGCSATATTTVVVNAQPSVNLGADVVQPNPPAVLDAGAGFTSYLWSTTETTQTISVTTNGQYIVTVTTAGVGCSDSDTINVNFTSGVVNIDGSVTNISLYPNPSNGPFNVSIDNIETTNLVIDIMDMTGRIVYNRYVGSVSGNTIESFDMTNLRMGTYVLRVMANGKSTQLRFIISQ